VVPIRLHFPACIPSSGRSVILPRSLLIAIWPCTVSPSETLAYRLGLDTSLSIFYL